MSTCYKCGAHWTLENKIETPLLCPECLEERQQIADDGANRMKMKFSMIPTGNMRLFIDKIPQPRPVQELNLYRQHVLNTLHEACDLSEQGRCFLDNGLFSDALMDFLCVQLFSGRDGSSHKDYRRAIKTLGLVLEKLEAAE